VKDRRLQVDNKNIAKLPSGYLREALAPENTLVYIGVKGKETFRGLSCDNPAQKNAWRRKQYCHTRYYTI